MLVPEQPETPQIVVLCGIPDSGKSTFARYLARECGFYYFSLNGEDDAARTDDLQQEAWSRYQRAWETGDAAALLAILRTTDKAVVIEWGFPPNAASLALVRALRAAEVNFVWFDCPVQAARARHRKRAQRDRPGDLLAAMQEFDLQISRIHAMWGPIVEAAAPQIVATLREGKSQRSHSEIYDEIFPPARERR